MELIKESLQGLRPLWVDTLPIGINLFPFFPFSFSPPIFSYLAYTLHNYILHTHFIHGWNMCIAEDLVLQNFIHPVESYHLALLMSFITFCVTIFVMSFIRWDQLFLLKANCQVVSPVFKPTFTRTQVCSSNVILSGWWFILSGWMLVLSFQFFPIRMLI